jgi:hypothetical protein
MNRARLSNESLAAYHDSMKMEQSALNKKLEGNLLWLSGWPKTLDFINYAGAQGTYVKSQHGRLA